MRDYLREMMQVNSFPLLQYIPLNQKVDHIWTRMSANLAITYVNTVKECFRKVNYDVWVVLLESCSGSLKTREPKLQAAEQQSP